MNESQQFIMEQGWVNFIIIVVVIAWTFSVWLAFMFGREIGRDQGFEMAGPQTHKITAWYDEGTGQGDDRHGWKCSCGQWGMTDVSANAHLDQMRKLEEINHGRRT